MPARLLCLALVTLPAVLLGAETLPSAGKAVGLVRDDTPGSWAVVSQDFNSVDVKEFDGDAAKGFLGCYFEGPAGRYLAIKSGAGKLKTFAVTLGGTVPVPTPPGPTPDPVPPQPPTPPPTPVAGPIRALVIYETADIGKLTWEQVGIINSYAVRSYFTTKGYKGPDATLALRFWDDDLTQGQAPADWWATYDAARKEAAGRFPWLIIETKDGKRAYSGPVGSEAEALSKLKLFGGE